MGVFGLRTSQRGAPWRTPPSLARPCAPAAGTNWGLESIAKTAFWAKHCPPPMSQPPNELLDAKQLHQALDTLANDIAQRWKQEASLVLVGIHRRGVPLAESLAGRLRAAGLGIDLGTIDITQYRDDLSGFSVLPRLIGSEIPCDIDGRVVILCDEVVHTGRTVRAALEELLGFGRPRCVEVAAVVERPQRELPIETRYAAMRVDLPARQRVTVHFAATDGCDEVLIEPASASPAS